MDENGSKWARADASRVSAPMSAEMRAEMNDYDADGDYKYSRGSWPTRYCEDCHVMIFDRDQGLSMADFTCADCSRYYCLVHISNIVCSSCDKVVCKMDFLGNFVICHTCREAFCRDCADKCSACGAAECPTHSSACCSDARAEERRSSDFYAAEKARDEARRW